MHPLLLKPTRIRSNGGLLYQWLRQTNLEIGLAKEYLHTTSNLTIELQNHPLAQTF